MVVVVMMMMKLELELELILSQMAQKPMLRGEVGENDDNDNDDYYDDDDHAFLGLCVAPDRPSMAKILTDDCSALYWTQELGLTCLESGRRAVSNEPSCFSRR